ncbi:hypothetical protein GCM10017673_37780 [Streptosporangium violaceochromogenes]|nr:hypothetical protein GCM10017673_37780 [Streptosporangium violaceochromogenes]
MITWVRWGARFTVTPPETLETKAHGLVPGSPEQPRGWHGRWIKIGSVVRLHGGGRATVVDALPGGWYQVRHRNGHVGKVHSRSIAEVMKESPRSRGEKPDSALAQVQPGKQPHAADSARLDDQLWEGLDPSGRLRLTDLEPPDADMLLRNRARAKRQIVEDLTRRIGHVDDAYVLDAPVRETLARLRSGESVMVRFPTSRVAEYQQPNAPGLADDINDWNYKEVTPADYDRIRTQMDMDTDFEVIGSETYRQFHRAATVSQFVHAWATSSTSPNALAVQFTVRDMFDLKDTHDLGDVNPDWLEKAEQVRAEKGPFLEAFARAQYDATQEWLAQSGVTHMHLFRGMYWDMELFDPPDWADPGRGPEPYEIDVPLSPLSSFTLNPFTAQDFVGEEGDAEWAGEHGVVLDGTVPTHRIFALPRTGIGCLNEWEAVVLGGTDRWRVSGRVGRYRFYTQHLIATAQNRYEQIVAIEFARSMGMLDLIPPEWLNRGQKALPRTKEPPMPRKRTWDVWAGGHLATDLDTYAHIGGWSRQEAAQELLAKRHRVDVPAELLTECEAVAGIAG